jgi:hypothetical protein
LTCAGKLPILYPAQIAEAVMIRSLPLLPLTLSLLALGACNQSTQQAAAPATGAPTVSSNVTPSTFRMPDGAGCTGSVNRFRAIMDNDLATGHSSKVVYDKVIKEIDAASAMCASGNDAGARSAISATRARYGYPAERG